MLFAPRIELLSSAAGSVMTLKFWARIIYKLTPPVDHAELPAADFGCLESWKFSKISERVKIYLGFYF